MTENWFVEFRMAWIRESVEIFGGINRNQICKKFEISVQQASHDIQKVIERWPDLMAYDKSSKRYERPDAKFEAGWFAGAEAMRKAAINVTDDSCLGLNPKDSFDTGFTRGVRAAQNRIREMPVPDIPITTS